MQLMLSRTAELGSIVTLELRKKIADRSHATGLRHDPLE